MVLSCVFLFITSVVWLFELVCLIVFVLLVDCWMFVCLLFVWVWVVVVVKHSLFVSFITRCCCLFVCCCLWLGLECLVCILGVVWWMILSFIVLFDLLHLCCVGL